MAIVTIPTSLHDAPVTDIAELQNTINARFHELLAEAPALAGQYASETVPHIVIDDFFPPSLAAKLVEEFPPLGAPLWNSLPTEDQQHKWTTREEATLPPLIRSTIMHLNSGLFLSFLEKLTGIEDLVADTKLAGGGLHCIETNGKLSVHIDFSHHPHNGLNRRLNLLLYLNPGWQEAWGGEFEFWSWRKQDKHCIEKVLPLFNRCVVFSTSPTSWHGHPAPLATPPGITRNSLALYYFSNGRQSDESDLHNTIFHSRPGEQAGVKTKLVRWASSGVMRDLMPPFLYRYLRRIWNERFTVQKSDRK